MNTWDPLPNIQSCDLLRSMSDAPKEIRSIIGDLDFFKELLGEILNNEKIHGAHPLTKNAVEKCERELHELHQIANSLVPGFASNKKIQRKWTSLTAVRKSEQIFKFQTKLRDAKFDLCLARELSASQVEIPSHGTPSLIPV